MNAKQELILGIINHSADQTPAFAILVIKAARDAREIDDTEAAELAEECSVEIAGD